MTTDAPFQLDGFLAFRLARAASEVSQRLSKAYAGFDLDVPQWRVLATIADRAPVTAQDIVASTRTHKSTISRAVRKLTERGWIERVRSNEDGRAWALQFTSKGEARFEELLPLVRGFEREMERELGREALLALQAGLDGLETVLDVGWS
ncbi:MAG: SMC-Scp complex subunit ScpB [Pseudomonadota bacterium]